MMEPRIDDRYTKAYANAHRERAEAFRVAYRWITGRK